MEKTTWWGTLYFSREKSLETLQEFYDMAGINKNVSNHGTRHLMITILTNFGFKKDQIANETDQSAKGNIHPRKYYFFWARWLFESKRNAINLNQPLFTPLSKKSKSFIFLCQNYLLSSCPKNINPERAIINISDSREADMSKVNVIMPARAGIIFPGNNLTHFPGIIFPGKNFHPKT